jgi:hypothetical protein
MRFSELELPSNKKFGFFFAAVFLLAGSYFFFRESHFTAYIFFLFSISFLVIALLKESLLLPLNQLWMRFGLLLGIIISPIVLGLIYFLLITPYGLIMRLFGRDELHLKINLYVSHWRLREQIVPQTNFKQQF